MHKKQFETGRVLCLMIKLILQKTPCIGYLAICNVTSQKHKTMDLTTFRNKIEPELKRLTKEQLVHFAWLCAVSALPILGGKGNFNKRYRIFRMSITNLQNQNV
jgi:hypothetical protein